MSYYRWGPERRREPVNYEVEKRGYIFNNRRSLLEGIHVLRINNKVHIILYCCSIQEFESQQEDSFFYSELIVYVAEA